MAFLNPFLRSDSASKRLFYVVLEGAFRIVINDLPGSPWSLNTRNSH